MTSLILKTFWRHNWLACIWSAFPNDRKCYTFKGYNLQFTVVIALCSYDHNFRTFSSSKAVTSHFFPNFQFSSVVQSCPTLCDPMNRSTPGLPVHHQLPEFSQTHVHRVGNAIQPSHPLSSPSPPAPNPSQHQGLFQWVNSSHEVTKVLEFQLQYQSFQSTPWTDLL